MRILLLSDLNSPHTVKWARALAEQGLAIRLFGFTRCRHNFYEGYNNIYYDTLGVENTIVANTDVVLPKLQYLKAMPQVRQIIRHFKPDILHAHFVTSYGLLGAAIGFHPYVLSAWGSDVMVFPQKSPLHRALVRFNLGRADKILSTSEAMARQINQYTQKRVEVTPFGIDLELFRPQQVKNDLFDKDDIVIGTVKSLYEHYGVDTLLQAFALLKSKHPALPLKLLIVGSGPLAQPLRTMAERLELGQSVTFTGHVDHDKVPDYHNLLSIYVALSNTESFGVAVIEAAACGKPVVVSDVGGLPEVVEDGVTGFIVPARNPEQAVVALEKLILDKTLRQRMGQAGRERVKISYNWNNNVAQMIDIYHRVL